jgi:hypothetical protein
MSAVTITPKTISDVITLDTITFSQIRSTSISPAMRILPFTLSGDPTADYNIVLKSITISGNTLTTTPITIQSTSAKISIDNFTFSNNVASLDHPSIYFVSVGTAKMSDSVFSANSGPTANDLYLHEFTTGTLFIENTVFTGRGAAAVTTTDYSWKPGVVLLDSVGITFSGCTFQDYPNAGRGAALLIENSEATLTSCIVMNNSAQAGAIAILDLSNVTATSSNFTGNQAIEGG